MSGTSLGGDSARKPSSRRAEALLAATDAGTLTLVVGGSNDLVSAISALGGRVVVASIGNRAAEEEAVPSDGALQVQFDQGVRLPFAAATFDSVFAPYLAASDFQAGTGAGGQFVRECARLLKPGGRLVLMIPNPSVHAVLRRMAALRRSPVRRLVPSRLAQRLHLGSVAPSPLPYSMRRLRRLLRDAGFGQVEGLSIWPRLGTWERLVPERIARSRRQHLLAASKPGALSRVAALLGVVPGRCIIARTTPTGARPEGRAPVAVLDTILGRNALDRGGIDVPPLMVKGGRIALVSVGNTFFKVALTAEAAERQRSEIEATRHLREQPAGQFAVDVVREGVIGRMSYAEYPLVEPIGCTTEADCVTAMAEAFRLLATGAELRPARSTESWRRIFTGSSRRELESLGADDLCMRLETEAGDKPVLAGTVHGDIHLDHVMRFAGRTVLIDWDRFEPCSPLIIDRCNGVYRLLTRWLRPELGDERHVAALDLMMRRDHRVPLLDYIDEAAGELTWWEVITLHVLSGSSWRVIHHGAVTDSAKQEIRQHLAFCRTFAD
jgi:SAM-dependent methyltransferase